MCACVQIDGIDGQMTTMEMAISWRDCAILQDSQSYRGLIIGMHHHHHHHFALLTANCRIQCIDRFGLNLNSL